MNAEKTIQDLERRRLELEMRDDKDELDLQELKRVTDQVNRLKTKKILNNPGTLNQDDLLELCRPIRDYLVKNEGPHTIALVGSEDVQIIRSK